MLDSELKKAIISLEDPDKKALLTRITARIKANKENWKGYVNRFYLSELTNNLYYVLSASNTWHETKPLAIEIHKLNKNVNYARYAYTAGMFLGIMSTFIVTNDASAIILNSAKITYHKI